MLRQQEERARLSWSSALLFAMTVVLTVVGVLLLLPARAPAASVGAPPPPTTEAVLEVDGQRDAAATSARTRPPQRADPTSVRPPASVPSGRPVGVRVEAIGVEARVIPLGLDAESRLEVPEDFSNVGWWEGGAEPGEPGPTILAGHVDSYQGPAVFYRLRDLEVGDEVVIILDGGESLSYRVTGAQEVPKNDFPTEAVYGHTPGPTLRLITCGGPFDRATGHYQHNTIVFAELT
jgi:LPXTG-site transpeptidase (sortase) family protein